LPGFFGVVSLFLGRVCCYCPLASICYFAVLLFYRGLAVCLSVGPIISCMRNVFPTLILHFPSVWCSGFYSPIVSLIRNLIWLLVFIYASISEPVLLLSLGWLWGFFLPFKIVNIRFPQFLSSCVVGLFFFVIHQRVVSMWQ